MSHRISFASLALLGLLCFVVGCGGGGKEGKKSSGLGGGGAGASGAKKEEGSGGGGGEAAASGSGEVKDYPKDKGVAVVSGKCTYDGPVRVSEVDTSADPKCAEMHKDTKLVGESMVVGANKEFANVVVSITKGLEAYAFESHKDPAILDQKGCQYHPHVLAVMVNQPVQIKNSDPTAHNVHGMPTVNPAFNMSQAKTGQVDTQAFAKTELIPVKCDIHSWMSSYIAVFDHPFYAVSGADGTFRFKEDIKLAPGKYTLTAKHENKKLEPLSQEIEVKEGQATVEVNFDFKKN